MLTERERILLGALKYGSKYNAQKEILHSNSSEVTSFQEYCAWLGIPDIDELMSGGESVINHPAIPEMSIADFAKSAGCKVIVKKIRRYYKAFFEHPEYGEVNWTDKFIWGGFTEDGSTPKDAITALTHTLNGYSGDYLRLDTHKYFPIPKNTIFIPSKIVFEPIGESGVHTAVKVDESQSRLDEQVVDISIPVAIINQIKAYSPKLSEQAFINLVKDAEAILEYDNWGKGLKPSLVVKEGDHESKSVDTVAVDGNKPDTLKTSNINTASAIISLVLKTVSRKPNDIENLQKGIAKIIDTSVLHEIVEKEHTFSAYTIDRMIEAGARTMTRDGYSAVKGGYVISDMLKVLEDDIELGEAVKHILSLNKDKPNPSKQNDEPDLLRKDY